MNDELYLAVTAIVAIIAGWSAGYVWVSRHMHTMLTKEKDRHERELSELRRSVEELERDLASANSELAKAGQQTEIVQSLCEDLALARSDLEQHQVVLEQELRSARGDVASLHADMATEQTNRFALQDELHRAKQDHLQTLQTLKEQWATCRHHLESEIVTLKRELSTRESLCQRLQRQCRDFEDELKRRREAAADQLARQVEIHRRLEAAQTFQQKLAALQLEFDRQSQELASAQERIGALEARESNLTSLCQQQATEVEALREAQTNARELELELQRLYRQLETTERQLENERQQHASVCKQRDEIQLTNRDLRAQLSATSVRVENQATNLRNLRGQLEKAKRDLQQAARTIQTQHAKIADWERRYHREITQWKSSVDELTADRDQQRSKAEKLETEREQLKQSNEARIEEITAAAQQRIQSVLQQRDQAFVQLQDANAELKRLKLQCERNAKTIRQLRSERGEVLQRLRLRQEASYPRVWNTSAQHPASCIADQVIDPVIGPLYRQPPAQIDDLKRISGVAQRLELRLHALGIYTFEQIAHWDQAATEEVSRRLGLFSNRIQRDQWVEQACQLAESPSPRRAA